MYRMVFQALLFTGLALGFILTKSDGLRRASQTGDLAHLTASSPITLPGRELLSGASGARFGGAQIRPWYARYDPRQFWRDRPKQVRLNPKTVRVQARGDGREKRLAAQMAAKGLNPDVVSVVKLD